MALVRGGWLWRQSSILRRWKRNWFALWLDGTLGYYHDETAQDEEDRVVIHFNVRDIKVGQECQDVQPPEGRSRDGLLTVNLREGSRLHLCAETRDDAIAWKTALMEANSTPVRVYSPYQDYYEVVPPNAHEATYVRSYYGPPYAGPGVTHVIVRVQPIGTAPGMPVLILHCAPFILDIFRHQLFPLLQDLSHLLDTWHMGIPQQSLIEWPHWFPVS